jgi:2-methylaconitate cis-trans-isomerase PrpF
MPPKEKAEAQVFTFETMACVLAVMDAKGATLGNKAYDLMAKLDGNRSASAFQHQFRAVKNRGKELVSDLGDETSTPKAAKSAKKTTTSTGKKRGSKSLAIRILSPSR